MDRPLLRTSAVRAACLCALCMWALSAGAAGLTASAGRAAAPPPGARVMAGYLTVANDSSETVRITGARSKRMARIEIHRTQASDGMTSMAPVAAVELAPGEHVRFAPGGLHLMMFEPKPRPELGDRIEIELMTSAGPIPVTLEVVEPAQMLHSPDH